MSLVIETINRGLGASNCYICSSEKEALVIDPGCDIKHIKGYLENKKLDLRYIIMTHGHYDHIVSLDILRDEYPNAIVYSHEKASEAIKDAITNGSFLFGTMKTYKEADEMLKENDEIILNDEVFNILETPGHSQGSVCILNNDKIFTGDVLFREGIGRSDLPGGDPEKLRSSLSRIMRYGDDTVIYPGHGRSSTIVHEKSNNPFLRGTR